MSDWIDRVAGELRNAPEIGLGVEERVLDTLHRDARSRVRRGGWIGVAALAASVVLLYVAGRGRAPADVVPAAVEFSLRAPGSSRVSIVGDFNDWDPRANPLTARAGDVWATTIPLDPGRYNYAFVVDGAAWVPGDADPRALGEDFGTPTSVVMVPHRST
jgi:hypothetical protein